MGTNFYIRRVKPREVHDLMHIAKRSAGWVIHFQDSTEGYAEGYADPRDEMWEPPAFRSVADIRNLLKSGEWQMADEYGAVWEPGEDSLSIFDGLCKWRGGPRYEGKLAGSYPDGEPPYDQPGGYLDPDGYRFESRYFR